MSYQESKEKVWEKGTKIPDKDPNLYREDKIGNVMYYPSYGKQSSMGWNIDHSKPQNKNGTNHLNNLQPLNSLNNSSKSDTYPYNYKNSEPLGVTRRDLIETPIDKRSRLIKNGEVLLNYDGTVNSNSKAVKTKYVILNKNGTINANSKAVKRCDVVSKKNRR